MRARFIASIIVLQISVSHAGAQGILETARVNTYLSQGYTHSTDNNLYGNSEGRYGSFSLRELGLNTSINISKSLFSSGQIIIRKTGQDDEENLSLDYALIDYSQPISEEISYGARLGRIKNPLGFYNETRDVAFTRPSVLLPQSIYFDRTRELALSADGLHLYRESNQDNYSSEITFGILKPRLENSTTTRTLLGPSSNGELDGKLSYVWKVELNRNPYTISYSGAALNLTYVDTNKINESNSKIGFLVNIVSLQYDSEKFSIISEYADRRFEFSNLTNLVPYEKVNGQSYYLQVTSLMSINFKAYLRYDILYQNRNDKNGKKFFVLTEGNRPNHSQYAKDWTLGFRWDINQHWMLSFEHHWIKGTAWLPLKNNTPANETHEEWRLVTGVLSFRY